MLHPADDGQQATCTCIYIHVHLYIHCIIVTEGGCVDCV